MTKVDNRRLWSSSLYVTSFTVCLSIESNCKALYFRSSNYSTKTERLKPKHMLRVLFEALRVFLELTQSNVYVNFTITEFIVPSATMKLR